MFTALWMWALSLYHSQTLGSVSIAHSVSLCGPLSQLSAQYQVIRIRSSSQCISTVKFYSSCFLFGIFLYCMQCTECMMYMKFIISFQNNIMFILCDSCPPMSQMNFYNFCIHTEKISTFENSAGVAYLAFCKGSFLLCVCLCVCGVLSKLKHLSRAGAARVGAPELCHLYLTDTHCPCRTHILTSARPISAPVYPKSQNEGKHSKCPSVECEEVVFIWTSSQEMKWTESHKDVIQGADGHVVSQTDKPLSCYLPQNTPDLCHAPACFMFAIRSISTALFSLSLALLLSLFLSASLS